MIRSTKAFAIWFFTGPSSRVFDILDIACQVRKLGAIRAECSTRTRTDSLWTARVITTRYALRPSIPVETETREMAQELTDVDEVAGFPD